VADTVEDFQCCPAFSISTLLAQDDLFRGILAPEVSKLLLRDFHLPSAILKMVALTQFCGPSLHI
jgi:hypothetical protein